LVHAVGAKDPDMPRRRWGKGNEESKEKRARKRRDATMLRIPHILKRKWCRTEDSARIKKDARILEPPSELAKKKECREARTNKPP
jgi:hypothetical protein